MENIVERLRTAASDTEAVENASVAHLLDEAAAQIERLSQKCDCPVADNRANADNVGRKLAQDAIDTLTDAEREAIKVAAVAYAGDHGERFAATLRALLERME